MGNRYKTEKLVFIALLVALCVVLGIVDRVISAGISPHPAIRLGLANIIILTALYYLNFSDALLLVALKTILTGFILGSYIVFLIGTFGSVVSFIIMYALIKLGRNKVSVLGISLSGAISHTLGQVLGLMYTELYAKTIIFSLLWLIPLSVVTGVFIGIIVTTLRKYLEKGLVFKTIFNNNTEAINLIIEDDE